MIILSEDNLPGYIRAHLADKLGFVTAGDIHEVAMAGGGLVSAVFKAKIDGKNLYFKQAIPGKLDKIKELVGGKVPEDAFIVWYDERQFAEVKALKIVAHAVPDGFVPIVYHHDTANNIMILSDSLRFHWC